MMERLYYRSLYNVFSFQAALIHRRADYKKTGPVPSVQKHYIELVVDVTVDMERPSFSR